MKIAVISDTHGCMPRNLEKVFSGVDAIIHAGDICGRKVIDALNKICDSVYAVLGNHDYPDDYDGEIPYTRVFTLDGVGFALGHEPETAHGAALSVQSFGPLVTIHGHTHIPKIAWNGEDRVTLCPGSLYNPRGEFPTRTVAFIETSNGDISDIRIETLNGKILMQ